LENVVARWITNVDLSDPDAVGYTIIAGWWPTRYYRVLTTGMKVAGATEGTALLTRQLHERFPDECGPARDYFVTVVHRTNRYGIPRKSDSDFEVEFHSREEAVLGHSQVVQALGQGKRHLSHLVSTWKPQTAVVVKR
jgi:hypothetical protein